MLDHVVDTCRQLDPDEFKKAVSDWMIQTERATGGNMDGQQNLLSSSCRQSAPLPDAFRGVDDGLHYAVSNELPVLLRDVIDRRLCA